MKRFNLQNLLIAIIIILLLFIARHWLKDKIITSLGGYTHKEVVTDTIVDYKVGKIDTLAIFNHFVKTKGIVLNPKPEIIYRDKYSNPVSEDSGVISDSIKKYNVTIKDSLIDGTFTVFNNFKGDLLDSYLDYKPLFPKYIARTDTIIKTITNTETLSNKRNLLGIGVGYNNLQYASLLGSWTTKNKWQIIYEYGKPLNKTKQIIEGNTFQLETDDLHSIKIIKHF